MKKYIILLIFVMGLVGSNYPMKGEVTTPALFSLVTYSKLVTMKIINEFDNYEIDEYGSIYSKEKVVNLIREGKPVERLKKRKLMKPKINRYGYAYLGLYVGHKQYFPTVHRLVALTYIPNPNNKPCINHKDGNKLNNHISNLEWVTVQENNAHAVKTGLMKSTFGCMVKQKDNTSGYSGVSYNKSMKRKKRWTATLFHKGFRHYLGIYLTLEGAVKARNKYIINNNLLDRFNLQDYE